MLGQLPIKTLPLITPASAGAAAHPAACDGLGGWAAKAARAGAGISPRRGLSRVWTGWCLPPIAWQLPALHMAPFDPAEIRSLVVHQEEFMRKQQCRVRKEPVYIFGRVDESIQPALFILANVLWIVRNFH